MTESQKPTAENPTPMPESVYTKDPQPSWTPSLPPKSDPSRSHVRLAKSRVESEATVEEKRIYQSAVGSLMYTMLGSHPEIAYAVSKVSQYCTNPDSTHWRAVKRIFRYLAGTPNRGQW